MFLDRFVERFASVLYVAADAFCGFTSSKCQYEAEENGNSDHGEVLFEVVINRPSIAYCESGSREKVISVPLFAEFFPWGQEITPSTASGISFSCSIASGSAS
ncbi:hypothetical protein RLO149_c002840 [Roseobacter litoralis Och 149]|uniref:Uncharacterized protein n=1 Tax=Roseobacter litoralis (strain ATCC 49566 / DSM 6996 / JCM 21268 / NBRC 15278 / OCh 149) TaxID=391595 RepID=F7ZGL4_ROSLO|nr:hypothetical protein RLO149_c002840 [Roseobacter litoralis Och 149]